ncbi:hypothetical protein GOP47_0011464 [Adiantum capillus-veneris]|uniref:alpha,alpha-trehalose-phosphate synthase (UDP-forming) n=1 Tax=Adiantum capillus-veneris TaxID=13818 RepID=A0A9D4ZHW3_ADICA|nr:hypothetical protein GOP47_0011464 [Adiantum capillus-veneris]
MPYRQASRDLDQSKGCGEEEDNSTSSNHLLRHFSLSNPGEPDNTSRNTSSSSSNNTTTTTATTTTNNNNSSNSNAIRAPLSSAHLEPLSDEDSEHCLSSKHGRYSTKVPASRVDRLLQQRQLSRSRNSLQQHDKPSDSESKANGLWERGDGWLGRDTIITSNDGAANLLSEALDDGRHMASNSRQRLLVVANRLPVSATRIGDTWSLELSAGGLVSALLGVRQFETRWIGWAGVNVADEVGQVALKNALEEKRCVPVFLDEETVHQYYNGYCNNVLWPLFHYLGLPQEDRLSATRSLEDQFEAYKRANSKFADVVQSIYKEGDVIWCHDYHLMFLPKCLKDYDINMKVGWFLHTPFPSSEIYRMLPSRSELLKAVLCADLIGFHTYDYARHFVSACTRILGLEGTRSGVEDHPLGKLTRVAAFPIGIDPERFSEALSRPDVKGYIQELQQKFSGRKVMLGVDRLDTIKGIPQKLLAFEKFLDENVEWRDKVLLVQIAVPTRTDVHDYQRLTSQVHEIVGRINGRFGTLTTVPIHHLDRSLDFHRLCALYAVTDVAIVTSLRDGMNLVSYEFVACQNMKKGVLILSELAGAAQSLGAGAILVNPWNISDVAVAIKDALDMPETDREECHRHNFEHVTTHTAQVWADTFVSELNDTIVEAELRTRRIPPHLPVEEAVGKYQEARNRLLILGFNATMTTQVERRGPEQIREMKLRLHPHLQEVFGVLCKDPKTTIVILSGSERSVLDEAFGAFDLWLAAENGMFLRHTRGDWKTTMPEHLNMDWMDSVQPVFDYFRERTPRSYVEVRETSLLWNYKYADVEFGRVQARDMLQHLWTGPISNAAVDVVQGGRSVEVRPVGVSKGAAIDRILGEIVHRKRITIPIDYVLCVGHFLSKDEDIYTFFEPELPFEREHNSNGKALDGKGLIERRPGSKAGGSGEKSVVKSSVKLNSGASSTTTKASVGASKGSGVRSRSLSIGSSAEAPVHQSAGNQSKATNAKDKSISREEEFRRQEGSSVLDLKGENYFSCAVGRKRSNARYSLPHADDVVSFLKSISASYSTASAQVTTHW